MMDWYHTLLRRVAHIQVRHPFLTVLLLVAFTLAIYGGTSKVATVASLEQMMPGDIPEIHAFNTLRDQGMGQDIIAIIIERDPAATHGIDDIRDPRVMTYVAHLAGEIEGIGDIIGVHSYATAADQSFISADRTTTMILATTDVGADDQRMSSLAQRVRHVVDDAGAPPGVRIRLTGTPIIQQRLGELIAHDRSSTRWISTILVFALVAITFGTLSSAIVPIAVVTMSVTWLYGTMGYTGLPISTLAGGVAAMVIGIGIDFAIHIMNKFKYERKHGKKIGDAIELAVVETGTALTATSLTTIAAFLAFLAGVMPEMGRFGILMAIGISYSLVFSLFGLPALLVIEERFIRSIKRRLRFGVEGEMHLEGGRDD